MNKVMTLHGTEADQMIQTAIDQNVVAIMSYLSKNKWYVAKVILTAIEPDRICVESALMKEKHPINIQLDQPVGVSFKYEYGKFVFDTTVMALEPSPDSRSSGRIALSKPGRVEVIQRRSYFRVNVPDSLKVNVVLWHRRGQNRHHSRADNTKYFEARLVDISAGGAQLLLDGAPEITNEFKQGQFISMRFTPLPYETPLMLSAQIRNVLPRAGGGSVYLGLQLVGLEASPEGQETLTRLVGIIERYRTMSQSDMPAEEPHELVVSAHG
jgi:c-di-GMP-binding flagellar brake protein YcgR